MKIEELVKIAEGFNIAPSSLTVNWTQIDNKRLYVSQKLLDRFYLIRSYETIVGVVDEATGRFLEMGKYSPTTSKQINYIYRSRFSSCERLFTERKVA